MTGRSLSLLGGLLGLLLWNGAAGAGRSAKKKGRPASSSVALPPLEIDLLSLDLASGSAHVLVDGSARAPEARFFTFTDERKRRFVPSLAECRSPAPPAAEEKHAAGRWECTLGIPRIYQRSSLIDLSVESRGHVASVAGDKVRLAWAEARARTPLSAVAERPREPSAPWSSPTVRRNPDAGSSESTDEVDSEEE